MGGQLLKLWLLFLSMTRSSSMDPKTTIDPEMETDGVQTLPISTMNSPLAALNDRTPTDSTFNMIDKKLMAGHGSSKESKVTTEQETSTAIETTQEETSTNVADAMTIGSNTSGPLIAPLNANTPSDEEATLNDISTEKPVMSSTSIKESKTTPGQEKPPTGKTLQEETTSTANASMTIISTTSEGPSSAAFSTGPVNGSITIPAGLPFTNPTNDNDNEMTTSSQTSGETGTSKSLFTKGPKNNQDAKNDNMKNIILIAVLMVLLVLILITIVVMLVRKRRRGSQDFSRSSSKRHDVWAGQVPELGEGKVTQHPMGVGNGTSSSKPEPGQEQEMVTFISAEKKEDSLVEVNELGKGDTSEKKPLLEDASQGNEEPEKPPVQEQIPSPTVE
ncbi:uncharacterized protein LOC130305017 [Hyla sarda]|uniref:uncharacterized protein LOC130305017 n=1 Tax=Hyla sarda TaxID=327740 RepID=UPI0024C3059D|nr:uncharacterized protein LOC130305017 [Hyla sarda]